MRRSLRGPASARAETASEDGETGSEAARAAPLIDLTAEPRG